MSRGQLIRSRGILTVMRLDIFLHCTLGGFAEPPTDILGEGYHSTRLSQELDWIAQVEPGIIPWGTFVAMSERWGRSANSLRVSVYNRRHGRVRRVMKTIE